jgi:hypothetical protein
VSSASSDEHPLRLTNAYRGSQYIAHNSDSAVRAAGEPPTPAARTRLHLVVANDCGARSFAELEVTKPVPELLDRETKLIYTASGFILHQRLVSQHRDEPVHRRTQMNAD